MSKVKTIRDDLDSREDVSIFTAGETSFEGELMSSFNPVSDDELKKIILSCKPTTCDLDPFPTPLLLECIDAVLPAISCVINDSLSSGVVPAIFKRAVVKPLLKKPSLNQNELKNYRPVSNLPFLSKILERIVLAQLLSHLHHHNLLSAMQSAYRPRHSTETALLRMVDDILAALDSGNISSLIMLDLSCAFDTIDHEILVHRLHSVFGLNDTVISWVCSYLSSRTQTIVISDYQSDPLPLNFGVPQGSVLGPVFFIMYTQPLSNVICKFGVSHVSYADDTQLYDKCAVNDADSMIDRLQNCILDVNAWMESNKLSLNAGKTEAILITSPRNSLADNLPSSITVNNSSIQFSDSLSSLGLTIDNTLSMHAYVLTICKLAYFELRRISSIRHLLSSSATKTLVCSFVLSRLDYCNSVLAGSPHYLIDKLQRVQNNAARLVLRKRKSDHATPLLSSLHWLPISSRIQYKVCSLTFSSLFDSGPIYLSDLLQLYSPTRQLRSSNDTRILSKPSFNTKSFGSRRFSHQSPLLWNSLPFKVRHSNTHLSFRSSLKTHLFQSSYLNQ